MEKHLTIYETVVKYKKKKVKTFSVFSSNDCLSYLRKTILGPKETFCVLIMNYQNDILETRTLGTVGSCSVMIREIFEDVLKFNGARIIVAHNHPSGSTTPSKADHNTTSRIKQACEIFGIDLLDHIIVTEDNHYSFSDMGMI